MHVDAVRCSAPAALLLLGATACSGPSVRAPTVYAWSFERPADLAPLELSDPTAWRVRDGALELFRASSYRPAVRSPYGIALLPLEVGDFTLEVRAQQTGREVPHRDLCFFFGFEDPRHFYYVHIASRADDHAHNVFVVDGAPRTKIARHTTGGVQWGGGWHDIALVRSGGHLEVFFDDRSAPIMVADDNRFARGRVGVGSFDDTGRFESIRLLAAGARRPQHSVSFVR